MRAGTGHCDTCKKASPRGKSCVVLSAMIGKVQPCWAWTDDPDWEQKCKEAKDDYGNGWRESNNG